MKHNLHVTAHTERGVFEGYANGEPGDYSELESARDQMQRGMSYLVLASQAADGGTVETLLPEAILSTAVLVFDIRPAQ